MSFGFIEHFQNYKEVIVRHADMVNPGVYIIITAPNFRKSFCANQAKKADPDFLTTHNIDAMVPTEWNYVLKKMGFEVLFCGYFGGISFIADNLIHKILNVGLRFSHLRWMPIHNFGQVMLELLPEGYSDIYKEV